MTRLQTGKLTLYPCKTEIVALVQRVVTMLQPTTARHQLMVSSTVKAREIMVDRERIEQVLVNLVGNAIKYSPEGGEIAIRIWEDAEEDVGISVQDHGIGIPIYQQGQIFGRFMRADNAHARHSWHRAGVVFMP